MITPCNLEIITTVTMLQQQYAVYIHSNAGIAQYVGLTPLNELFSLRDAHCNSMWSDIFARDRVTSLEIKVVSLTTSEREAYEEQRRLIAQLRPVCNIKGYWIEPRKQRVECVQTGEIFETATEASKAHNIAYSQLSNHLNGKPGHRTVKGRTYVRTLKDTPR